jgi:hypothetical protein
VALTQNHNETVLIGATRPAIEPNHNETVLVETIRPARPGDPDATMAGDVSETLVGRG